jgi:L-asparagine transporter-like permease
MTLRMNVANGLIVVGFIMILFVFAIYYMDRTNTINMSMTQIFAGVLLFGGWVWRKRIQQSIKKN